MDLYDYIWKRKSTRKYDITPLDSVQLDQITQFADNLKPLYPNIKIEYEITSGIKSILPMNPIKAPHYFVISSEKTNGYLENVGFMFQQMDLFLSSIELGSCWFGLGKPAEKLKTKLSYVSTLAFGKAAGTPYRDHTKFKRKALSDISIGTDDRLEAVRLAPSAINNQNWFFEAANGKINVFHKKAMIGVINNLNKIDIGIALCHLFVATKHFGKDFSFSKEAEKKRKGYTYTGTI